MGQELIKEISRNDHTFFSGGYENPKHANINKKISELIKVNTDQIVSNSPKEIFSKSDVVIDFTTPESTLQNLFIAAEYNTPIVIGTTGLDKNILDEIRKASKKIPILHSSNMSVGINILFNMVENLASALKEEDYDIEIAETHHRHKIDAPSGTAISLGEHAARGRKTLLDEKKELNRSKLLSKRKTGNIGFAVTRGGEIAGEHTVSFIGNDDRIDVFHKAYNRSIFVKGAIEAAIFISDKKVGLYSMDEIIKSK